MKKLLITLALLAVYSTTNATYPQFICKSLGDNNQFNLELFLCRLENHIDYSTWYN